MHSCKYFLQNSFEVSYIIRRLLDFNVALDTKIFASCVMMVWLVVHDVSIIYLCRGHDVSSGFKSIFFK